MNATPRGALHGNFRVSVPQRRASRPITKPIPKAPTTLKRKYVCYTEYEPRRRRSEAVDSISADNLLEQLNTKSSEAPAPD